MTWDNYRVAIGNPRISTLAEAPLSQLSRLTGGKFPYPFSELFIFVCEIQSQRWWINVNIHHQPDKALSCLCDFKNYLHLRVIPSYLEYNIRFWTVFCYPLHGTDSFKSEISVGIDVAEILNNISMSLTFIFYFLIKLLAVFWQVADKEDNSQLFPFYVLCLQIVN